MIAYGDIRDVHLELSTLCNAACPLCPRNLYGYPFNDGYPECNLTLSQAQKIFELEFLNQLHRIRINGNFGDIVMNPQGADIVQWFRDNNSNLEIQIFTNGGARSREFWQSLARARAQVHFSIDGLEDTNHLYRQNVDWSTLMRNVKNFIEHGGRAVWKMIRFDHNQHQIDTAQQLSQRLGFCEFVVIDNGRDSGPRFDRRGVLQGVMGQYQGETSFPVLFQRRTQDQLILEDILDTRKPSTCVTCETQTLRSIYIAANGDVSPCCYTGFYPKTYGHGHYHQAINQQLAPLMRQYNALEYPLAQCIQWFQNIESSWKIQNYQQGRLVVCDDNCGSCP